MVSKKSVSWRSSLAVSGLALALSAVMPVESAWAVIECPPGNDFHYLRANYNHPAYGANTQVAFMGANVGTPAGANPTRYFTTTATNRKRNVRAMLTVSHLHCVINEGLTNSFPVGFVFSTFGLPSTATITHVPVGSTRTEGFFVRSGSSRTGRNEVIEGGSVIVKGGVGFFGGVTLQPLGASGSKDQIYGYDGGTIAKVAKGGRTATSLVLNDATVNADDTIYKSFYSCPRSFPVVVNSPGWNSVTMTGTLSSSELRTGVNGSGAKVGNLICYYTVDTSTNVFRVTYPRATNVINTSGATFLQTGD